MNAFCADVYKVPNTHSLFRFYEPDIAKVWD